MGENHGKNQVLLVPKGRSKAPKTLKVFWDGLKPISRRSTVGVYGKKHPRILGFSIALILKDLPECLQSISIDVILVLSIQAFNSWGAPRASGCLVVITRGLS